MAFPTLSPTDIKTAIMGEQGADIKLSPAASEIIQYSFECKNTEAGFSACYKAYQQALAASDGLIPVVVFKQNRHPEMVIIAANDFIDLIRSTQL